MTQLACFSVILAAVTSEVPYSINLIYVSSGQCDISLGE